MNTVSSNQTELIFEFTLLRINANVQMAFERDLQRRIPGLLIQRVSTRQKDVLYKASGLGPRPFVLLGIAIQVFNDQFETHDNTNRQLEKTPTGSPDDPGTRADGGQGSLAE